MRPDDGLGVLVIIAVVTVFIVGLALGWFAAICCDKDVDMGSVPDRLFDPDKWQVLWSGVPSEIYYATGFRNPYNNEDAILIYNGSTNPAYWYRNHIYQSSTDALAYPPDNTTVYLLRSTCETMTIRLLWNHSLNTTGPTRVPRIDVREAELRMYPALNATDEHPELPAGIWWSGYEWILEHKGVVTDYVMDATEAHVFTLESGSKIRIPNVSMYTKTIPLNVPVRIWKTWELTSDWLIIQEIGS